MKEWGLISLKLKLLHDEMGKLILSSTLGLVTVLLAATGFVPTCACIDLFASMACGRAAGRRT